jgi:putative intracellular protease/amidase
MSKIAVLITDMFEDVDYTKPAAAFIKAGQELVHVDLQAGKTVRGKKAETPVTIDKAVKDISVNEFDALFIPGGYSPDKLRVDDDAVRFVKAEEGPERDQSSFFSSAFTSATLSVTVSDWIGEREHVVRW